MIYRAKRQPRAGTILPLVAVCLITLLGFVALAIDIGVMQVARTQCQNAADTAAIAGARSLTGDSTSNYNYAGALPAAQSAADGNSVLGQALAGSQAQIAIGKYRYDSTQNQFIIDFDPNNNYPQDAWSLVQSTVTASHTSYFPPSSACAWAAAPTPGRPGCRRSTSARPPRRRTGRWTWPSSSISPAPCAWAASLGRRSITPPASSLAPSR